MRNACPAALVMSPLMGSLRRVQLLMLLTMGRGDGNSLYGSAGDIPINGVVTEGAAVDAVDNGGGNGNSLSGCAGNIPIDGAVLEGAAVNSLRLEGWLG
jgi:hypothetical protein